ncbi:MAG: pyrroline-5-carboxylate reductase dimerization domain-containing protein, partial [Candidatus Bathyarchaeia archaeon]
ARFADAVVIAVPPRNVLDVLKEIRASLSDSQILVSLAALISTSLIEETLQMRIAVARVMPNIACLVGAGFNVYSFGRYMTPEGRKWTEEFLGALGVYRQIDEEKMEIYSILSAMGPTYFLPFVDNLIKFGENEGLSQEEARIAVASTLGGTAQLISQTRRPVEEIKNLIGTQPLQKRERELRTVLTEELSRTLQQMRSAKEKLDRTASRAGVKQ